MKYNSQREDLVMPEYGRNIQRMVDYALKLQDREERNRAARAIIEVIGNLNPHLRDNPDFRHKLWDHLHIMSDFQLDVESPYEKPSPETFAGRPNTIDYPVKSNKYRHYGSLIHAMIDQACREEDPEKRRKKEIAIANHMKKTYLIWNKDTVVDEVIFKELAAMSAGRIKLSDIELSTNFTAGSLPTGNGGKGHKNQRRNKNFKPKGNNKHRRFNKPPNR